LGVALAYQDLNPSRAPTFMFTAFFDLDGTLVDSKEGITRCLQTTLDELGAEVPTAEELEWCIGPSLFQSFTILLGEGADIEGAVELYREHYANGGIYEANIYDGLGDMFEALQSIGARMYIATSKLEISAKEVAEHFGLTHYIDRVFGSEPDGTREDKTELLAFALSETETDPAKAVMIGDRRFDIFGAKNNNVANIGVLWGFGGADELREAEADMLAGHPEELPEIIGDLLGIN